MRSEREQVLALAVETSGRVGSVAVGRGETVLAEASFQTQHHHGVELLPTADRLCRATGMAPRSIAEVYVSGGPGSFTGLRIGVSLAKAMAFANGARLVRVSTLAVIAQNARDLSPPPARLVVILDAKRRHLFASSFVFREGGYEPLDEPRERDPLTYLPSLGEVAGLGEGIAYHREAVSTASNVRVLPEEMNRARASTVYTLGCRAAEGGAFIEPGAMLPVYVRRPEAEEKWEARQRRQP